MSSAPIVRSYSSPGPSGAVNAFWILGETGVVVVDALRELSQARELAARIAQDELPIAAIVITHSHADHTGGLPALLEAAPDGVPVYATQITAEAVRGDAGGLRALTRQLLGEDFPPTDEFPDPMPVKDRGRISVAGLELELHDLGAGEAASMLAVRVLGSDELIVGDLVGNGYTPLLLEGRTGAWLTQLDNARERFDGPLTAHPGHGGAASIAELLDQQAEYLQAFRKMVAQTAQGRAELSESEVTEVVGRVHSRFPGLPTVVPEAAVAAGMPPLVVLNVAAVAAELAAEGAS